MFRVSSFRYPCLVVFSAFTAPSPNALDESCSWNLVLMSLQPLRRLLPVRFKLVLLSCISKEQPSSMFGWEGHSQRTHIKLVFIIKILWHRSFASSWLGFFSILCFWRIHLRQLWMCSSMLLCSPSTWTSHKFLLKANYYFNLVHLAETLSQVLVASMFRVRASASRAKYVLRQSSLLFAVLSRCHSKVVEQELYTPPRPFPGTRSMERREPTLFCWPSERLKGPNIEPSASHALPFQRSLQHPRKGLPKSAAF